MGISSSHITCENHQNITLKMRCIFVVLCALVVVAMSHPAAPEIKPADGVPTIMDHNLEKRSVEEALNNHVKVDEDDAEEDDDEDDEALDEEEDDEEDEDDDDEVEEDEDEEDEDDDDEEEDEVEEEAPVESSV